MSTDAPEPGLYGFAKHPRRVGRLTVDPVRDAERRGVMAVLGVLTSQQTDDPTGLLTFHVPNGATIDGTVIMRKIEETLAEMRSAAVVPRPPRVPDSEFAPDIVAFLEARLDEAEAVIGNTTQGPWKMWGIRLLADQDGTGNIATAVPVADVYSPPQHERLRTWNATHIQNYQPMIVQKQIDSYRRIIERFKSLDPSSDVDLAAYVNTIKILTDLASFWDYHEDWNEDWAAG